MSASSPENIGFLINLIVLIAGTVTLFTAVIGCCIVGCFRRKGHVKESPVKH